MMTSEIKAVQATLPVPPALRVVHGQPTDEELAVLTAVLLALAARPVLAPVVQLRRVAWSHEFDYQTSASWRAA